MTTGVAYLDNQQIFFIFTLSWYVPIDNLMYWKVGTWSKFESKGQKLILRIHYDQLLITCNNKVLESLNMQSNMKGIHKEDILILLLWNKAQEIRKIKFQIISNIGPCLQKLGEHFPVVNHNSADHPHTMKPKFKNLGTVIKRGLDKNGGVEFLDIPSSYKDFVKLCLMDPAFPQLVTETEKILTKDFFRE